jgi:hypothetical protein
MALGEAEECVASEGHGWLRQRPGGSVG